MQHALIIDDHLDIVDSLKELLASEGMTSDSASSVEEAFELLDAKHFDVLIVDVMMPHLNGFYLIQKLRQNPADRNGRTPAIAYSGLTELMHHQTGSEMGFQALVGKPKVDALLAEIRRHATGSK